MNSRNAWRLILVIGAVLWAAFEIYPPTSRNLIDEFERRAARPDTNFTAIVAEARRLDQESPLNTFNNLREAIGTRVITNYFPEIKVAAQKDPTRTVLYRLQQSAAGRIKLGLDLQGGTSFLVAMDTNSLGGNLDRESALSQAVEVLRKRVDRFGVSEPIIQPAGTDRMLIQLPGLSQSDYDNAKTTIQKAAFLEFRLVHPDSDELLRDGIIEPGYVILKTTQKNKDGVEVEVPYLVKKNPERGLTGAHVKGAGVSRSPMTGEPEIDFTLNDEGASLFAEVTRENVGRLLAIVLDGELYSAPVIRSEIPSGRGQISGRFDLKEAFELANVLENPLQAPVRIIEERRVDPSLGKDSITSGIKASLIGVVAVAIFMLVYYLLAGLVANLALLLNIVILLGVMCSIDTTLTLPGIAGIVLTIGMAVDANVLIYERIREELAAGKSIRGAVAAGYSKAFGTIFDSNLTTLISSVILIFMGTGPVKGFGVTLTIGISVSMFTALIATRLIFDFLLARGWLRTLPMLHLVRGSGLDFMRWAKAAFIISWCLILVGNIYGISRGQKALGVEFRGGVNLSLSFAQKIDSGQIREAISELRKGEPAVQFQKELTGDNEVLRVSLPYDKDVDVSKLVGDTLKEKFPEAKFMVLGTENIGPTVGAEIQKTAIVAMLLALFGILIYVAFRYEFSFAVGAVIAIIHDILMTMGWFFLSGREMSAPMVAAILTIIGFSINDTIVIFDRIREDLKLGMKGTFTEIMNQALNQTLSRTIITSGTVFLATLSLFLFGGGAINDFAFTFLVGILTGTYSSIYIASAVVLWWHKGQRPKMGADIPQQGVAPVTP